MNISCNSEPFSLNIVWIPMAEFSEDDHREGDSVALLIKKKDGKETFIDLAEFSDGIFEGRTFNLEYHTVLGWFPLPPRS